MKFYPTYGPSLQDVDSGPILKGENSAAWFEKWWGVVSGLSKKATGGKHPKDVRKKKNRKGRERTRKEKGRKHKKGNFVRGGTQREGKKKKNYEQKT